MSVPAVKRAPAPINDAKMYTMHEETFIAQTDLGLTWDIKHATDQELAIHEQVLCVQGCIRVGHMMYLYLPSTGDWTPTRSDRSYRLLGNIIGAKNATVNFAKAVAPYVSWMESMATELGPLDRSSCIGRSRFKVTVGVSPPSGCTVTFTKGRMFIPAGTRYLYTESYMPYVKQFGRSAKAMLVVNSISCPLVPHAMNTDYSGHVQPVMSNTMPEEDLRVLMWIVGNSLRDPVDKALIGYILEAKGGEGKSIIVNMIMDCCKGCVAVEDLTALGHANGTLNPETKRSLASHRLGIVGDLTIHDKLNPWLPTSSKV